MDLPNEMIFTIWNKLDKIDVLYSFIGVNKRFNELACNIVYTRSIDLRGQHNYSENCSLTYSTLDRFCLSILPQIHERIESLTFDAIFMERILSAGPYSRLQKLTIINIKSEILIQHFIDESPFSHIFKQQITHLKLSINDPDKTQSMVELSTTVFHRIFSIFINVAKLDFGSTGTRRYPARLKIDDLPSTICFSSSIIHLRITVDTFDDCLCLLDGRLRHLRRLVIRISNISTSKLMHNDMVNITAMKSFSLTSHIPSKEYDSQVKPLILRMINLEDLMLRLTVENRSTFIDSTHLNNEILPYLLQLQTLNFNIVTYTAAINGTNQTKLNKIQHTFYKGESHQSICYIDQYPRGKTRSHIYSIPYILNDLLGISSNFPGGLFAHVHNISLVDMYYAFEHDFFIQIAHSFPRLTCLHVFNRTPQKYKRLHRLNENDRMTSIIEFSHLTDLTISSECIDYVEQFLVGTNTRLPCLAQLTIDYQVLEIVTENFTRNDTRLNCANIERLRFWKSIVHSKEFYMYFPSCK